ncbi:hypothetical protein RJD24_18785 [Bacillaceae bacterium IKA-2]|nr:hypothetical protein RJD24_18785 [Bacillaceae bacterium IKA-2]
MELKDFINEKIVELGKEYRSVKFEDAESVMLGKNSTCSEFNSKQTSLSQKGKEVNLHEIESATSVPFKPNGTIVAFKILLPRKRKEITKGYYFLWDI